MQQMRSCDISLLCLSYTPACSIVDCDCDLVSTVGDGYLVGKSRYRLLFHSTMFPDPYTVSIQAQSSLVVNGDMLVSSVGINTLVPML